MSKIAISRTNDVITVARQGRFKAVFHAKSYDEFRDMLEYAVRHEPNTEAAEPRKARAAQATEPAKRPGRPAKGKPAKEEKKDKKPSSFIIEDSDGKRIGPGEFVKRVIVNTPGNTVQFTDLVTNLAQYARARNEEKKAKVAEKSITFLVRNPKNKLAYDADAGTVTYLAAA